MSTQQQEVITLDIKDEDGTEEGEIVDEFEYILSSEEDEETITKRIRELEARNDELEKIATISGACPNYPTDVFEISDYEEDYYSKGSSSRGNKNSYHSDHNHRVSRRTKKRRPRRKKKQHIKPRVVVPSDESASSDSDEDCKVPKDILRFAVQTTNFIAPNKRNLKDRLTSVAVQTKEEEPKKEIVDVEEDSNSLEEHELRWMALKSAIWNRHSDRVKRKKESTAYSPSDFDAVLNQSPIIPDEGIETPNMDISPIASPTSEMSEEGDVQPVDMDIENSEEENFPIAQFQEEMVSSADDSIPKPKPIYQTPDNEEEEEEEALRALLLSKMNSPKVIKAVPPAQNDENQENMTTAALILKKAVQRLQEKQKSCDIESPVEEPPPPVEVLREKAEENQQAPQEKPKPEEKVLKLPPQETIIPKPTKRKPSPTVVPVLVKKSKTNLITTVPNYKVNKLIISITNSEDEDQCGGDIFTKLFLSTNTDNFAEAASPSSLFFVENSTSSPSTPRSNSPFVSGTEPPAIKKQITNDVFEAKLDSFLKNARSQVEQSAKKEVVIRKAVQGTPMAVRHLPESSREEYRKLIKRMELLEKQKELGLKKLQITQQKTKVNTIKITIKNNNPPPEPKRIVIKTSGKPVPATVTTVPPSTLANPEVKPKKSPEKQTPVNKEDLFHKVETQYNKNESLLIENLSKNLALVETAMVSKTRKLELESRLSFLAEEIKKVESGLKEENTKINKIYPQIRFLHKTMEDLRSKRSKLYKYANTLGKTLKNGQISLKDSRGGQISTKLKTLAVRMKALKALNKDNITLTKDCSTQVELEVDEDQKSNDDVNENELVSTPPLKDIEEQPPPPPLPDIEEEEINPQITLGMEITSNKSKTPVEDKRILKFSDEYVSPLISAGSRMNISDKFDPNSVICPYALIGRCVDKDCKYNHI